MFERKQNFIGIDIGNHFIKIVSLGFSNENIIFNDYIIQRTPNQLILNGIIQDPVALSEIISSILEEHNMKVKNASISIGINEDSAMLKWLQVPNLKNKEMVKAINTLIEDELRYPPSDLYYNWSKIEEKKVENKDIAEILLVGVPKASMDSMLSFLRKSKIKPYFAEANIFSTFRSLIPPNQLNNSTTNLSIIDIGLNQTLISFINNGKFSYLRSIPFGANDWIENTANTLVIDRKKAEEEVLTNSAISSDVERLSYNQQIMSDILTEPIDTLLDEIRNTIEFYQDLHKTNVNNIILSGGGARVVGIESYAQERLGIPTEIGVPYIANSLDKIKQSDLSEVWPSLNVALGLALKEAYDNV